jgi:hypothetical protein
VQRELRARDRRTAPYFPLRPLESSTSRTSDVSDAPSTPVPTIPRPAVRRSDTAGTAPPPYFTDRMLAPDGPYYSLYILFPVSIEPKFLHRLQAASMVQLRTVANRRIKRCRGRLPTQSGLLYTTQICNHNAMSV